MTLLEGPHREVQCRQRERQDLGHMLILGSMSEEVWGSTAKADLDNPNQKEWGFG